MLPFNCNHEFSLNTRIQFEHAFSKLYKFIWIFFSIITKNLQGNLYEKYDTIYK